jgi:flagellar motor component MotA
MNTEEFAKEFTKIFDRAVSMSDKARREGLLAIEDCIDWNKVKQRDVLELGLRLVIDGTDFAFVDKVLSNLINLEEDPNKRLLGIVKKEAVLRIQDGSHPRMLMLLICSYVSVELEDAVRAKYDD